MAAARNRKAGTVRALTHLDDRGRARMVDVGAKATTERVAIATATLRMLPATQRRIRSGRIAKGEVLAVARIAGIMAAKRTPDLVPLCHPIALSGVEVEATPGPGGVEIVATVRTVDRTGVEMEALAAVSAGCLTVYDMLKRYERGMRIEALELIEKRGGRSGHWRRAAAPARAPAARARSRRTRAG